MRSTAKTTVISTLTMKRQSFCFLGFCNLGARPIQMKVVVTDNPKPANIEWRQRLEDSQRAHTNRMMVMALDSLEPNQYQMNKVVASCRKSWSHFKINAKDTTKANGGVGLR